MEDELLDLPWAGPDELDLGLPLAGDLEALDALPPLPPPGCPFAVCARHAPAQARPGTPRRLRGLRAELPDPARPRPLLRIGLPQRRLPPTS